MTKLRIINVGTILQDTNGDRIGPKKAGLKVTLPGQGFEVLERAELGI